MTASSMQIKLEDLEKSVTFLGDQNISLMKALDNSERNAQLLDLKLKKLGRFDLMMQKCRYDINVSFSQNPKMLTN